MPDQTVKWFKVAALAIIAFWALLMLSSVLFAHEWYDLDCCDTHDCRPVSGVKNGTNWSEIEDHEGFYLWHSSQSGRTHKIPKGDERIRPSRNGHFHGCEVQGEADDVIARCLYVPTFF